MNIKPQIIDGSNHLLFQLLSSDARIQRYGYGYGHRDMAIFQKHGYRDAFEYLIFTNWRHQRKLHVNPRQRNKINHLIAPLPIYSRWMKWIKSPHVLSHLHVSLKENKLPRETSPSNVCLHISNLTLDGTVKLR
jgi:hypothetical protein